jgi:hypothetical protein
VSGLVFTVKGKRYELPDSMTFGDAALLRKMGLPASELKAAHDRGDIEYLSDPVVAGGLLLVAMRRAGERVHENSLDDLDISEVEISVDEPEQAAAADPPTVAAGEASEAPTVAAPSSETTPDVGGAPI